MVCPPPRQLLQLPLLHRRQAQAGRPVRHERLRQEVLPVVEQFEAAVATPHEEVHQRMWEP